MAVLSLKSGKRIPLARNPSEGAFLFALAAANFAASLWLFRHALTVFPNTGDEFSGLFQAKIFSKLQMTAPAPPFAFEFNSDYIEINNGRWFSIYPPGYPLLLAIGVLAGNATWAVAVMSSLILVLVFRLVRDAYKDSTLAWLTTLLLFVSPTFRFHSSSYYSHIGSLLALVLCLNFLSLGEHASSTPRGRWWCFGLAAGLGLAIRPFEFFLALVPLAAFAASPGGKTAHPARSAVIALLVVAAASSALVLYSGHQSGDPTQSRYLQMVNHGGRLGLLRNLNPGPRLAAMVADTAKWLFGFGWFPEGNLKDLSADDLNWSWPLLLGGSLFALHEALKDKKLRRIHLLFLGLALSSIAGHIFYAKKGGRFGERRFFEVSFVFCLFVGRLALALLRRRRLRNAWALCAGLAAPSFLFYLPRTIERIRQSNERRMLPYLMLESRGISGALVFLQSVPEFYPRFYARNEPDLSGNVFALMEPEDPAALARLFPGRPKFIFLYDQGLRQFVLKTFPMR